MNSSEHQDSAKTSSARKGRGFSQGLSTFTETFGLSRPATIGVILFVGIVMIAAVFWFIYSAPPRTLIITSGPSGSTFQLTAERYRDILSSNGVTLHILPSQGSLENLPRLAESLAE